ncbi:hypothetical protein BDW59DRAFT_174519 [Aspergillus cavernicola]|uniref:C2H2-type domain-containing protein n=1 Tax=Aspergillus cavernicola TaxID=176166 RepID=A0ABR4HYD1_9EURO
MSLKLSHSPPTHSPSAQSSRRLSVGAKSRICVHCGRSFRRTEHLERHVRTHTKEKPYTCFCGAAFSRRDLLKRHMGITGHEDTNPPNTKSSSPKSRSRLDHDDARQRTRRTSTHARQYHAAPVSEPPQDTVPPSPEEAPEAAQWTMQQSTYAGRDHGILDTTTNEDIHDPEVLEAAQLLLPGGLSTSYTAAQASPPTLSYYPEDLNHFEEFTHYFLDSIGLPLEWVPGSEVHNSNTNTFPTDIPEQYLHPSFREQRERSRATSPFRSWLPSAPQVDQSYGMVSDYGNIYHHHHHHHPPGDMARVVPNL